MRDRKTFTVNLKIPVELYATSGQGVSDEVLHNVAKRLQRDSLDYSSGRNPFMVEMLMHSLNELLQSHLEYVILDNFIKEHGNKMSVMPPIPGFPGIEHRRSVAAIKLDEWLTAVQPVVAVGPGGWDVGVEVTP